MCAAIIQKKEIKSRSKKLLNNRISGLKEIRIKSGDSALDRYMPSKSKKPLSGLCALGCSRRINPEQFCTGYKCDQSIFFEINTLNNSCLQNAKQLCAGLF